ncbi:MAG: hypothetical protein VX367_02240 [SAR324 cluster bacterium]|nr:hypothetical protein [SAR324 cluster bacterium]
MLWTDQPTNQPTDRPTGGEGLSRVHATKNKVIGQVMHSALSNREKNTAVYTATPVVCGWAGAV